MSGANMSNDGMGNDDKNDPRKLPKRAQPELHGDEIDLTPEDEAALDVAWAVIVEREKREKAQKAGAQ